MARPRSFIDVTCPNKVCSHYRKEEGKDIIKKGKNRAGHRQYYCFNCRSYFVETKETPLYHKHLSENEIIRICKLLVEKNGIRSIERITGHHRDTIGNLLSDLAYHADKVNNYLLNDVELSEFEVDEMWTFIKKSKRNLAKKTKQNLMQAMHGYTTA